MQRKNNMSKLISLKQAIADHVSDGDVVFQPRKVECSGLFEAVIVTTLPAGCSVARALARLESRKVFGKIIVTF